MDPPAPQISVILCAFAGALVASKASVALTGEEAPHGGSFRDAGARLAGRHEARLDPLVVADAHALLSILRLAATGHHVQGRLGHRRLHFSL